MFKDSSLYRSKNVKFFAMIGGARTARQAAADCGISFQHANNLVRVWRTEGLLMKASVGNLKQINKNAYTDKGEELKAALLKVVEIDGG